MMRHTTMKLHLILSLFTLAAAVKSQWNPQVADTNKTVSGTGGKLAVLISGLEDSFSWAHTVDRVISPAARQGFTLDFFVRLVGRGRSNGAEWSRVKFETASGVDAQEWMHTVMEASMQTGGSKSYASTDQSQVKKERSVQVDVDERNKLLQPKIVRHRKKIQSMTANSKGQSISKLVSSGDSHADTAQSKIDKDESKKVQSVTADSKGQSIAELAAEWSSMVKALDAQGEADAAGFHVALAKAGVESRVRITSWKEAVAQLPASQIKVFEIVDDKEHVDVPPDAPEKISQYSPKTTTVGRNLLRRWKSIQCLWHKALEEEKAGNFRYMFVMVAREDPTWLSSLNMNTFNIAGSQNAIFSKNCNAWKGLNDKVFVFGRLAAEKSLTGLYTEFWNNTVDASNAEGYWKAYTASKGVQSVLVSPLELATSDTKWQRGEPCQHMQYHCNATYEQSPVFCEYDHMKAGCDCTWTRGGVACTGPGDGSFCWNQCCEEYNPIAKAAVAAEAKKAAVAAKAREETEASEVTAEAGAAAA
eukprot:TRINITY_DN8623_c0_g1_i1.p1 TRINITY_DN8623_c0_g1~~TRINITY_DN8623_c0_g1_i1.p1  ORF type:complete len:532 (-),score=107.84 TRINITY_DN8623_c0_g1_i1:151-1746(-)